MGSLGRWAIARKELAILGAVAGVVHDAVEPTPQSIDARLAERVKADVARQKANRDWLDKTIGVGGADRAKEMLPSIWHVDFDGEGACMRAALQPCTRRVLPGQCASGATRCSVAGGCAIKGLWHMFADEELTAKERADLLCGCLITGTQLSALSAMREWMALDELRGLFGGFGSFRAACRLPEFPATLRELLADPATAPLVTELIKRGSGIARLTDKRWLAVSARLTATGGRGCAGG